MRVLSVISKSNPLADDLVERLRQRAEMAYIDSRFGDEIDFMNAADAIERLRAGVGAKLEATAEVPDDAGDVEDSPPDAPV